MNWDDPMVQAAVGRRMNSMWQYERAVRPIAQVPEWPPYAPMPEHRIPAGTFNPPIGTTIRWRFSRRCSMGCNSRADEGVRST